MVRYYTSEAPFAGRWFTGYQMHEIYGDMADKREYPSYDVWLDDMLRSGVFIEM